MTRVLPLSADLRLEKRDVFHAGFYSDQKLKIGAVAAACFAFFVLQINYSYLSAIALSISASVITWRGEKSKTHHGAWFAPFQFDKVTWLFDIALFFAYSLVVPVQKIAQKILIGDPKTIFLAIVLGPISEEILFRGFLEERIKDGLALWNKVAPAKISQWAQAFFFGICHITGRQLMNLPLAKISTLTTTTLTGFRLSLMKQQSGSLLAPIFLHATGNLIQMMVLLSKEYINYSR